MMTDERRQRVAAKLLAMAQEIAAKEIAKNPGRREEILDRLESYKAIVEVN